MTERQKGQNPSALLLSSVVLGVALDHEEPRFPPLKKGGQRHLPSPRHRGVTGELGIISGIKDGRSRGGGLADECKGLKYF